MCCRLGVPIDAHETEGPSTCLVFLSIERDTVAGEPRLPQDKLARLQGLLHQWGDKKVCTRRELESLVSLLNHACKVVHAGRSFCEGCLTRFTQDPRQSFTRELPQSASTLNSGPIWLGGRPLYHLGMASHFYRSPSSSRYITYLQTPQAIGAVVPFQGGVGSSCNEITVPKTSRS